MNRLLKNILATLFCVVFICSNAENNSKKPSYLRIPPMVKAPLIDGKIQSKEWQNAAESFGCLQIKTNYLAGRDAVFYIGYDAKNLYFACKSELPPKGIKLLSRVKKRDGKVYADDAVELLLMPPHKKFVYQFIANSLGTFFDVKYPVQRDSVCHTDYKTWNPKAKSASTFRNGNWEIEVLIPLDDLGIKKIPFGKEWRLQMTRDWRQPAQATPWDKSGQFCNPASMGIMLMDKNVPAVHFKGLGDKYKNGKINIEIAVFNPSKSTCKVKCDVNIVSGGPPRAINYKNKIASQKEKVFTLKYSDKSEITRDLYATVKDLDSGKLLMRRNFKWENRKGLTWENPEVKNSLDLDFAYYPYRKLIKYRLDYSTIKDKINDIKFYTADQQGKIVGDKIAGRKIKTEYRADCTLPELSKGKYKAIVEIAFKNGKINKIEKEFIVKKFPWEHNKIGLEKIIIPPFKPLKTNKNKREVSALMTGYRIKGLFWDKIYSQGENILASPIKLVINDKTITKNEIFKFNSIEGYAVNAQMSVSESDIKIKSKHEYDYDGMCKVTLDIIPRKKIKVKSVWIEIPMKKSVARLMHTMHNTMKKHPADFIPKGDGVVWDSTMGYQSDEIRGNFRPYFWMGWIYKGFCWFTASDKDWSLNYEKAAIQVVRKGDAVILKINIVNKPCVWEKPFQYVMGFQPTPVKPRMKGWRRLSERQRFKAKSNVPIATLAGACIWGADGAYDPWPAGRDYSMTKKLAKSIRKKSAQDTSDVAPFVKKHFPNVSKRRYNFVKRHLLRGRNWGKFCDFFAPYLNPTASEMEWEEYQVYMDEWWYSNYRANASDDYNNEPCRSYQDMFLFYVQKLVRNGMDGLYYDNIRDRTSYDMTTGPAHELPDGKIQPYFTFFSVREFLKRTYTMLYLEGKTLLNKRPYLVTHMTNTNIVPFMSFSTIALDLESKFGPADFQDRFSEGLLLTETLGTQTGCAPEILVGITGKEKEFVTRTFLAVTLAYDLPMVMNCGGLTNTFRKIWEINRNFGYGSDLVKVFACWDENNPLKVLTPKTRCALYLNKQTNQAIIIVADFGNGGTAKVDISSLGFKVLTVSNLETGKSISLKNNKLETNLKKHDFKIFIIKGKE